MTWGSHCPLCGLNDCKWVASGTCEGANRERAFPAPLIRPPRTHKIRQLIQMLTKVKN